MFSIIIPTMWKFKPFTSFLETLVLHPQVGEIILINNLASSTPEAPVLSHPKVKMHTFPQNIFVNPAWNFGVAVSQFDNLCILNDDVIFDPKVLDKVSDLLQPSKMFAVNLPPLGSNTPNLGSVRIRKFQEGQPLFHFGCLMFIHKNDWIPIPAGLNLYYGDNWMWDSMKARYDENYVIEDLFLYTPFNTTGATLPDREYLFQLESLFVERYWPLLMKSLETLKKRLD